MEEELLKIYELISSDHHAVLGFTLAEALGYSEYEIIDTLFELIDPRKVKYDDMRANPVRSITFGNITLEEISHPTIRYRLNYMNSNGQLYSLKFIPCKADVIKRLVNDIKNKV